MTETTTYPAALPLSGAIARTERGAALAAKGATALVADDGTVTIVDDAGRVLATGRAVRLPRLTPATPSEAADLIEREAHGWPTSVVGMAERIAAQVAPEADALHVGRAAYRVARRSITAAAGARGFARLVVAHHLARRVTS